MSKLRVLQVRNNPDLAKKDGLEGERELGILFLKMKTVEEICDKILLPKVPETHVLKIQNTKKDKDGWMDSPYKKNGLASVSVEDALLEAKAPTDPDKIKRDAIRAAKGPSKKDKEKAEKEMQKIVKGKGAAATSTEPEFPIVKGKAAKVAGTIGGKKVEVQ